MSRYLILAESIIYKNNKLTCINIYDRLTTVAMPSEIKFDLAVLCGPNWTVGEHNLTVKAKANNGKEFTIGELKVEIPNRDFVYNAYAQNIKVVMDYSISDLTIMVYDNEKKIIARKYPVVPLLVPKEQKDEKKNKNV